MTQWLRRNQPCPRDRVQAERAAYTGLFEEQGERVIGGLGSEGES